MELSEVQYQIKFGIIIVKHGGPCYNPLLGFNAGPVQNLDYNGPLKGKSREFRFNRLLKLTAKANRLYRDYLNSGKYDLDTNRAVVNFIHNGIIPDFMKRGAARG